MSALAMDVLREVSEAGGTVRLEGDMLRLSAPQPLPDELRARVRQRKAEIVTLLAAPANDAARASVADEQVNQDLPAEVTVSRGYRRTAGPRSSATCSVSSSVDGCTQRSTLAGAWQTCSAATRGRRAIGSTALASSCSLAAMRSPSSLRTWRRSERGADQCCDTGADRLQNRLSPSCGRW